jgi:thiamine phosphate synthase YjbQ (UPF0047 family)
VHDMTADVRAFLDTLVRPSGILTVTSHHTTTGITVNEYEPRLVEDLRLWLCRKAPSSDMYLHNDLDQREPPGTCWRFLSVRAHVHFDPILAFVRCLSTKGCARFSAMKVSSVP